MPRCCAQIAVGGKGPERPSGIERHHAVAALMVEIHGRGIHALPPIQGKSISGYSTEQVHYPLHACIHAVQVQCTIHGAEIGSLKHRFRYGPSLHLTSISGLVQQVGTRYGRIRDRSARRGLLLRAIQESHCHRIESTRTFTPTKTFSAQVLSCADRAFSQRIAPFTSCCAR